VGEGLGLSVGFSGLVVMVVAAAVAAVVVGSTLAVAAAVMAIAGTAGLS
jgi:hypothetical protein